MRLFVCLMVICLCSDAISAEGSFDAVSGHTHYMLQCQGCHKANGEGIDRIIPNLKTHGRQMLALKEGRQFFVAVPGSANSPLTDQQLSDVLNHIMVEILDIGMLNDIHLFTSLEVSQYRSEKMQDVAAKRLELINWIESSHSVEKE